MVCAMFSLCSMIIWDYTVLVCIVSVKQSCVLFNKSLRQEHYWLFISCLVGAGAVEYARMRGFETCDPKSLITGKLINEFNN